MARTVAVSKIIALMLCLAPLGANPSLAQQKFPSKPVKIILPIPAGSGIDVVTRIVGEQLSARWGQGVVVENRPGGGGIIAAQAVATAPADGYTLLGGVTSIFTVLPAQKDERAADVVARLMPVGLISYNPLFLAVSPKLGVNTFAEFMALTKKEPQKIVCGTNGAGTLPHLAAVMLAQKAHIPLTILPYATGGTNEAIRDIMGGRIHATIEGMSGLQGAVQSGDLKIIAVMAEGRLPEHPNVPTLAESLPGVTALGWSALVAPFGTPDTIMQQLSEDLRAALETASVRKRFEEIGTPVKTMGLAEVKSFVQNEQKLWWPMVKQFYSN